MLAVPIGYLIGVMKWGLTFPADVKIVTVIGSIFMFRLIIFLYDQQHIKEELTIREQLSYFFMLPNLTFPIFPVVDYKTFLTSFYDKEDILIYQRGLQLIIRGITHILLYRIIYFYLVPVAEEVQTGTDVLIYITTSYLLILRLSGMFHILVGILCLFGYNLPDIFNNYFLAAGFNDYWKRINVYWKDFVLKIFYYPIYFKIRKIGANKALALSAMIAFVFTWFLHGYQWFWIIGDFPRKLNDFLFWIIFGALVTINLLLQSKKRTKPNTSLSGAFFRMLNVIGMLLFMITLWSFWNAPSLEGWYFYISKLTTISLQGALGVALVIAGLLTFGTLSYYLLVFHPKGKELNDLFVKNAFHFNVLILLALLALATAPGKQLVKNTFGIEADTLLNPSLNQNDRNRLYKGYYENLIPTTNITSPLWEIENTVPDDWDNLGSTDIVTSVDDIRMKVFKPSSSLVFKEGLIETNQYGLRDKEYALIKPQNTIRAILLGSSIDMGSGVDNGDVYEAIIEKNLSGEDLPENYAFECLNFSISGIKLVQSMYILEHHALEFQPDIAIYVAHSDEIRRINQNIVKIFKVHGELHYQYLSDLFEQLNLDDNDSREKIKDALKPHAEEVCSWGYQYFSQTCIENGITPVMIYMPSLEDRSLTADIEQIRSLAFENGFEAFLEVEFPENIDYTDLWLTSFDFHPSKKGHEYIAKSLSPQFLDLVEQMLNKEELDVQ